ncbi:protein FAM110C [Pteronotus mesoamericanus]|uniref:protein FAM110C n=1 Tax=Pteronotus mesoamericanus TaxID=1884717 RepID=UPI0023EBB77F|nr:protein FAM110C [Pteronotus parnellii mesoamericanus]
MHALPGLDAPPVERLLSRGSDAAGPVRGSAVERLAADRAKYVRGLPGAARDPASEGSSPGTGEGQAVGLRPPARAPGAVARRAIARKPLRPDSLVIYRQKCEFVRGQGTDSFGGGLVKKLFPGPGKDKTSASLEKSPAGGEGMVRGEEVAPTKPSPAAAHGSPARPSGPAATPGAASHPSGPAATPAPPTRPSGPAATPAPPARPSGPAATPAPPTRPSGPAATPAPPARPSGPAATPGPASHPSGPAATPAPPARPSGPAATPGPASHPSGPAATPAPPARPSGPAATPGPASHRGPAAPGSPEPRVTRRRGLQRSQSDLTSRYSMSAAEFDAFFQFCGLDPEVVEALGRENFSPGSDRLALKVRSVSMATSDSGFSRQSGDDEGLQEEELMDQVPGTTSVVERNARIIKWLYTCKKATEPQGPRRQDPA